MKRNTDISHLLLCLRKQRLINKKMTMEQVSLWQQALFDLAAYSVIICIIKRNLVIWCLCSTLFGLAPQITYISYHYKHFSHNILQYICNLIVYLAITFTMHKQMISLYTLNMFIRHQLNMLVIAYIIYLFTSCIWCKETTHLAHLQE